LEEVFASQVSDKDLISECMKNFYSSIATIKSNNPIKTWAKDPHWHFSKDNIETVNSIYKDTAIMTHQ
jgi:hypothetical protein